MGLTLPPRAPPDAREPLAGSVTEQLVGARSPVPVTAARKRLLQRPDAVACQATASGCGDHT